LIVWAGEAFGLILLVNFIPELSVNSFETALAAVVVFGLLNAIFWPISSRLTFPFLVYTVGIGALLLNGLVIWLTSQFVEGITVKGWAVASPSHSCCIPLNGIWRRKRLLVLRPYMKY